MTDFGGEKKKRNSINIGFSVTPDCHSTNWQYSKVSYFINIQLVVCYGDYSVTWSNDDTIW